MSASPSGRPAAACVLLGQRGQEQVGVCGDEVGRQRDDDDPRADRALARLDRQAPPAMIDAQDLAIERGRQIGAMRGDDAPVALGDAPVHAAVVVAGEIARRHAIELGAAVIGADGVDQRVPAASRLEKRRRRPVGLALGERIDLRAEAAHRLAESFALEGGNVEPRARARPGRRRLVDAAPLPFGDRRPRIAVPRMKPAAAEIERQAGGLDRPGAPAEPVARLDEQRIDAGFAQAPRGAHARRAAADDDRFEFPVRHDCISCYRRPTVAFSPPLRQPRAPSVAALPLRRVFVH